MVEERRKGRGNQKQTSSSHQGHARWTAFSNNIQSFSPRLMFSYSIFKENAVVMTKYKQYMYQHQRVYAILNTSKLTMLVIIYINIDQYLKPSWA